MNILKNSEMKYETILKNILSAAGTSGGLKTGEVNGMLTKLILVKNIYIFRQPRTHRFQSLKKWQT